jgi:hypothetical protein
LEDIQKCETLHGGAIKYFKSIIILTQINSKKKVALGKDNLGTISKKG